MKQIDLSYRRVFRILMCIVMVSLASACTTMKPLEFSSAANLANQLEVGDTVEITRSDGTLMTFKINDISDSGISGGGQLVAYTDIRQVQTSQAAVGPTVGIVAAVVAVAALAGASGGSSGGTSY